MTTGGTLVVFMLTYAMLGWFIALGLQHAGYDAQQIGLQALFLGLFVVPGLLATWRWIFAPKRETP